MCKRIWVQMKNWSCSYQNLVDVSKSRLASASVRITVLYPRIQFSTPKLCDTFDELLHSAFVIFPCDMPRTPASGDAAPLLVREFCLILQLLGITLPDWSKKKEIQVRSECSGWKVDMFEKLSRFLHSAKVRYECRFSFRQHTPCVVWAPNWMRGYSILTVNWQLTLILIILQLESFCG